MANLIEGIQRECNRCRELVKQYETIGPEGNFGKAMIQVSIARAEAAIAGGDVVEMLAAFSDLKECKS